MNKHELKEILEKHKQWLESNGELGERAYLISDNLKHSDLRKANLRGADLRGSDLRYSSLRGADLIDANLEDVDLRDASLEDADLAYTNLREANLSYSDLVGADLRHANLRGVDLRYTNLREADLRFANLRGANLSGADLTGADLAGIEVNSITAGYYLACPEEVSFIGFKKCENNTIVKLLIPEDAKRSNGTSRKCRASKAVVLEITNENGEQIETTESIYDHDFIYKVGETVEVKDFDEDRWNECSTGIHFFITRKEAEEY